MAHRRSQPIDVPVGKRTRRPPRHHVVETEFAMACVHPNTTVVMLCYKTKPSGRWLLADMDDVPRACREAWIHSDGDKSDPSYIRRPEGVDAFYELCRSVGAIGNGKVTHNVDFFA